MPNYLLAAALANSGKLPSGLLFALVPLLVLVVALDVYCLIDLARARSVRYAPKIVWAIIILFVSAPIGALIYLFAGREGDRVLGPPNPDSPLLGVPPLQDALPAQEPRPARECPPILTTSGLTKDYGGAGLFDVDLRVPRGSVYGLVGPNGAGKTTLLSLLSAIRRPDRGTITMDIARNQVAVCPDVPEFDRWLTAVGRPSR